MSSCDLGAAPWSDIADAEFRLMEHDRFVAGEFVWTGFDYLGEPTPFADPARSSYFGAVGLCEPCVARLGNGQFISARQVLGEAVVETTVAPAALRLTADRSRIAGRRQR